MRFLWFVCAYILTLSLARSQGTVWLRNKIGTEVDAPFFDEDGIRLEGSNYVAQLYGWKKGDGFLPVGAPVSFATNEYFFSDVVIVPFVYGCNPVWVQVRAWAIQGGTTFEEAAVEGGWTGVSGVLFLAVTGNPARPETGCEGRLIGLQYPGSPLVLRQPLDQTVLAGTSATLSMIASSGVLMSYQWYQQSSDRPDGLIVGATNATYTTPALTNNATSWVSVSNSAGQVLSDKATVTVVDAAPRLSLRQEAGLPVLTLYDSVGLTYRIEYNTKLGTTNWARLVDLSLHSNPFTFIDSGATDSPARFYRAVAP